MRPVAASPLWIGNVADARNPRAVLAAGIEAVVDLALNEPPAGFPRELAYLRFPLLDGAGNPTWLLRAAVGSVAQLVRDGVPTLVFCGAGMSRSPAVAAVSLALARGAAPGECLEQVTAGGPCDVSAGLWNDLLAAVRT